jgi:hypothetical protein
MLLIFYSFIVCSIFPFACTLLLLLLFRPRFFPPYVLLYTILYYAAAIIIIVIFLFAHNVYKDNLKKEKKTVLYASDMFIVMAI